MLALLLRRVARGSRSKRARSPTVAASRTYAGGTRSSAAVHLASPLTKDVAANPLAGIRDICSGTATVLAAAARPASSASSGRARSPCSVQSGYPAGPLPMTPATGRSASMAAANRCARPGARAHAADGLDVTGLRLSVVYGAGRLRGYMSYPSHLMREAAAGRPVHIAHGPQRLHWQHVEEVAAAIVADARFGAARRRRHLQHAGRNPQLARSRRSIRAARPTAWR